MRTQTFSILMVLLVGMIVPAFAADSSGDQAAYAADRARSQALAPADRTRAVALFKSALGLWRAGDFDAAQVGFERGLGIDPGNGPANFYLGDIAQRAGKTEEARERYQRTLFFAPDSPEGLKAEVALGKLPPPPIPEPLLVPMVAGAQDCTDCPRMVTIPAGRFVMGSPANEKDRSNDEDPQHEVTVPAFALGVYDVTFAEWDSCVTGGGCNGYRPDDEGWGRGQRPVINVSWDDAHAYVAWVSRKTGKQYRLPSEAEWEYAARAGATTAYYWGDDIGEGNANCFGCGSRWDGKQTAPVGQFRPNRFGLYDMAGNVRQWTEDCFNSSYQRAPGDGRSWTSGSCSSHIVRGCSSGAGPADLRSAKRSWFDTGDRYHFLVFRLARTLP